MSHTGTVLVGKGRSGDFVHATQGTATEEGFSNVSKGWYPKTKSLDEVKEALQKHYDRRHDLYAKMASMVPGISDDGKFCLTVKGGAKDGASYTLTDYAMKQYLDRLNVTRSIIGLLIDMIYPNQSDKENPKVKIKRDRGDVETFIHNVNNGLRHYRQRNGKGGNDFLFRTYDDTKEIQAVLTDKYSTVDNRWYLDIVGEMIPGGRFSHIERADDNTFFGNVLIPDSIREEDDSDYGGMLSLSNCEIGKRKLSQYPSIFRAICMNGCIWDQTAGNSLNKRHIGIDDMDALKKMIVENLTTQIPLAHAGIDRLLNTRASEFQVKDVAFTRIFMAVADTFHKGGFTDRHMIQSLAQFRKHENVNKNLFGIINSVTRAGQTFTNDEWTALDAAGGVMTGWDEKRFNRLVSLAKSYDDEEVTARYQRDAKYLRSLTLTA